MAPVTGATKNFGFRWVMFDESKLIIIIRIVIITLYFWYSHRMVFRSISKFVINWSHLGSMKCLFILWVKMIKNIKRKSELYLVLCKYKQTHFSF